MKYDPIEGPVSEVWLEAEESERIDAVTRNHEQTGVAAGSLRGHAIVHSMVETQLARGLQGVGTVVERLQTEGLDRHGAVHAVGSVLRKILYAAASGDGTFDENAYGDALRALTAAEWRKAGDASF